MTKSYALIVEDDEQLSQIFQAALQGHFYTEIASDGLSADMLLKEIAPKLVILDLNLPGLPGQEILHIIRTNPKLRHTQVIVCTADAVQAEIVQDKADIVLLKPVSPIQLRNIAARLVSK